MADPSPRDIRINLINKDDEVFMGDDIISLYIKDAKLLQGSTDEIALRYYVCYLIAQSWGNLKDVSSVEGTSYTAPVPEKFLELYTKRLSVIQRSSGLSSPFAKVSVNRDFRYDDTTKLIRPVRSSDNP